MSGLCGDGVFTFCLCRNSWQDAVLVAKEVLSDEKTKEMATGVVQSLKELISILESESPQASQAFEDLVTSLKPALDVEASVTAASGEESEPSVIGKEVQDLLVKLRTVMDQFGGDSLSKFALWLDQQWANKDPEPEEDCTMETFQLTSVEDLKSMATILRIQG